MLDFFSFSLLGRRGDTAWANENYYYYYIYMVATNPNHHAELFSFWLLGRRGDTACMGKRKSYMCNSGPKGSTMKQQTHVDTTTFTDTSNRIRFESDFNQSSVQNWTMTNTKFYNRRLGGMPLPGNRFVTFVRAESMHALSIIHSGNEPKSSCWTGAIHTQQTKT